MKSEVIEQAEKSLNEIKRGFLIKFKNNKEFKNFKEVIEHALQTVKNNEFDYSLPITVYSKSNSLQCKCTIGRGIGDIYRLCKNYFPETKLKDVVDYLENNRKGKRIQYCYTTKQTVFRKDNYDNITANFVIRGKNGKQFK